MRDLPQLRKKEGTALVLSGGATKAFYFHLGVLKALRPDSVTSIVGSSAGAVLGAFLAAGASVETLLSSLEQKQVYVPKFDAWIQILTSTMLFRPKVQDILHQGVRTVGELAKFVLSLPFIMNKDILAEALDALIYSQDRLIGAFDAVALEDLFRNVLPSSHFSDTEIDLFVTGTNLDRRRRAVFNSRYDFSDDVNDFMTDVPIHQAVRASSAIPGLFEPVKIKDTYYVDGEIQQTLSADIGVRLADQVIVSHTYQPLHLKTGSVRDLGWMNVIKQSTSVILGERIEIWRQIYQRQNPDKDILWIQPDPEDLDFFLAPDFSFRPEVQKQLIRSGEHAVELALANAKVPQRA